jgi:hypothetical protein
MTSATLLALALVAGIIGLVAKVGSWVAKLLCLAFLIWFVITLI